MFSTQSKLLISSLVISACRAQDDTESASQSPRLLSNENSAALTAGALGLGIGVAGSLIVSKLIDDAAKCKPPAIGKLIPLPDILKFNPVNPDCNKLFPQASNYRETYPGQYVAPTQYPSQGYDVVPSSPQYPSQGYDVVHSSSSSQTSYQPVPVQLTPTNSYSQPSGFSQTSSYTATPNRPLTTLQPSPAPIVPSVVDAYVSPQVSYVPNPAIQPRGLSDLFSPESSKSTQFTETEAVIPDVDTVRTGKALEAVEAREVHSAARPVLFQPLSRTELNNKAAAHSGFSQTEAVSPTTDSFRNGKSFNSEVEILVEPREFGASNQRLVKSFSETEAVVPQSDLARSVKQITANSGRVLFRPQDKVKRQGKSLSTVRQTEPKAFTKSLSDPEEHPVVAVADISEVVTRPKTFTAGV